jgi:hypothetical protein
MSNGRDAFVYEPESLGNVSDAVVCLFGTIERDDDFIDIVGDNLGPLLKQETSTEEGYLCRAFPEKVTKVFKVRVEQWFSAG